MRSLLPAALLAITAITPGTSQASQVNEDCIRFDPSAFRVSPEGSGYLVHDLGHRLFHFEREDDARQALATLQRYGLNMACYVGRPNAPMQYFLIDGEAPAGPMPGENCSAFDRASLGAADRDGQWQLDDELQTLVSFQGSRNNAELAASIIHHYRFDQQCQIGAGPDAMMWFRRDR